MSYPGGQPQQGQYQQAPPPAGGYPPQQQQPPGAFQQAPPPPMNASPQQQATSGFAPPPPMQGGNTGGAPPAPATPNQAYGVGVAASPATPLSAGGPPPLAFTSPAEPSGAAPQWNAAPAAPQGQPQAQQQYQQAPPPPMQQQQGGAAPPPMPQAPPQPQQGGFAPPPPMNGQQPVAPQPGQSPVQQAPPQQGYPPQQQAFTQQAPAPAQQQAPPPMQQEQGNFPSAQQQGGYQPQAPVPAPVYQQQPAQQQQPQQQQTTLMQQPAGGPSTGQQGGAPGGQGSRSGTPTGGSFAQQPGGAPQGTSPGTPATPGGNRRARPRPAGSARIDSSQVPSPCRDLHIDHSNRPRFTTSKGIPPLTVTNFMVTDDGNASPKFIRPTLHASPYEDSFLRDSHLPWGAVLSPLNDVAEDERPPLVSLLGKSPIRCNRCRAYINPHVKWLELGRQWQCNFCDVVNDIPWPASNLDSNGRRRDHYEHPELARGSIDLDVDGIPDYNLKGDSGADIPAQPYHHLFALDVSVGARSSLNDVVETIRNTVRQMGVKYPDCKVSFITYASTLHFYNFQHPNCPQMVVADVENPFVPLPFNLLCWMNVDEESDKIEAFLDRVMQVSEVADETDCAVGAVAKVCSLILSATGGKVILTATKMPTSGLGVIKPREVHKIYGSDKEKELFQPMEGFWPQISIECAKKQISFDLLMFPTDYCELITLGQLCHLTNGIQSCFFNYSSQHDSMRLQVSLERSLLQLAGYGAILRMRCSPGVRIKNYSGHFLSQDPQDMDLAAVHAGSTFYVEFQHEGKIDHKGYTYFQCAMLYTSREGKRRVRVHTLRLPVCNTYSSLFRNGDLEANLVCTVHRVLRDAVNKGPKFAREEVNKRMVDMLVAYRKYCSSGTHSGQLLLPEQLKLLPLFSLCMCKGNAVVVGTDTRMDERAQSIHDLMTMPTSRILYYVYPKFYSLRNMLQSNSIGMLNTQTNSLILPPLAQLTTDIVMTHGLYALHDQQANAVYLWVGSQLSPNVSQSLFNTEDPSQISATPMEQWNERLQAILYNMMRSSENGVDRLIVMHEKKDSSEEAFFRNMLEDEAIKGAMSYSDLLCDFHKKINSRLM